MKLAILFVALMVFTACTGQATQMVGKPLTCIDSDGGKEYNSAGTVMTKSSGGIITTNVDKCVDGKLLENYCDGGNYPRTETVSCNCKYGVCI